MNKKLTHITKLILDFMFYTGILIALVLPLILTWYGKWDQELLAHLWPIDIILTLCGISALLLLWELRKIFKTVILDACFVLANVTSLRRMGNYSFLISLLMLLEILVYPTLASAIIILVFLIAGMFSKVLAQVFARAIDYKQETDYTI